MSFDAIRRIISGRMPGLDGIRGIGILIVMVAHFSWFLPTGIPWLIYGGWAAMESFFVLSGFLITGILLDSREAENYFSSFYQRRALRILPLYYGTLFVGFIVRPLLGRMGVPFLSREFSRAQVWYWFYAANFASFWHQEVTSLGHLWSLAVEEQFYLVWPCVVFLTSRRALARTCIVLALAAPVLRVVLYLRGINPHALYCLTTSHLESLCLGALTALIVRDENWLRRLVPRLNYTIYPSLVIFCLLGISHKSFDVAADVVFVYGIFFLAILFAGVVLRTVITTESHSFLQRCLQFRWLRSYGKYSYAIYIFHWPLVWFYFEHISPLLKTYIDGSSLHKVLNNSSKGASFLPAAFNFLYTVALLLFFFGLGKFSWWAFEGPINNLRKHFAPRWRAQVPQPR